MARKRIDQKLLTTLRIIGSSYGGVWPCIAGFWDLQTTSFEIPWFLGQKGFFNKFRLFLEAKNPPKKQPMDLEASSTSHTTREHGPGAYDGTALVNGMWKPNDDFKHVEGRIFYGCFEEVRCTKGRILSRK